jgi:hypothetical protein
MEVAMTQVPASDERGYSMLCPYQACDFNPFKPDLLGTLLEVEALLRSPARCMREAVEFRGPQYWQVRRLIDRALQRNVPLGHPATRQAYLVSMEKGGGHGSK